MNLRWAFFALVWMTPMAWAQAPAKLSYSSQTDFTEITVSLKKVSAPRPEFIQVDVKLTPEARARTKALSLLTMHKRITLYLNGRQLNTATVQSVLDRPGLTFSIPRDQFLEMMPSLLE